MEPLVLPLDRPAIEGILPHRYPFLLVDQILELEPDRRIVGIKHIAADDRWLTPTGSGRAAFPSTILVEAVAQVGAIMVLAKPENRGKLIFFMGIRRARFRRPVYGGEVVRIEAAVRLLRSRMGLFDGFASVDGHVVARGAMTFALGPTPSESSGDRAPM